MYYIISQDGMITKTKCVSTPETRKLRFNAFFCVCVCFFCTTPTNNTIKFALLLTPPFHVSSFRDHTQTKCRQKASKSMQKKEKKNAFLKIKLKKKK